MELTYSIAAAAGLLAHHLCFIRGEWHLVAPLLFMITVLVPVADVVLAITKDNSGPLGVVYTTILNVASFYSALFTSIAIYRLLFHPLRRYPGPFWAKLSKLWHFFHCLNGQNHLLMEELYHKYGNVVRVGETGQF